MRRITIWIAATLAVIAGATYYQVSLSGDGKEGGGDEASQTQSTDTTDEDRTGGTPNAHVDKPGESK